MTMKSHWRLFAHVRSRGDSRRSRERGRLRAGQQPFVWASYARIPGGTSPWMVDDATGMINWDRSLDEEGLLAFPAA